MSNDREYKKLLMSLAGEKRPVIIVTGAPGSGKSTYVQQNKTENDLVIDLDAICMAIHGDNSTHDNHDSVVGLGIKLRDELYKAVECYEGSWEKAYIVTASADRKTIQELIKRFDGTEHQMEATREQCIDQIMKDPSRKGREDVYIDLANKWFDETEG